MKDQSHLEEMRAAIRGDRERAAARRAAGTAPQTPPPPVDLRVPSRPAPQEAEPAATAAETPEPLTPEHGAQPDEPRRGLFGRLFGR